ncbi:MAG: hypothetical protein QOD41_937 [Cryptosporangiaceae bacterium]|nr:hypothetical protein [Cryptosporangiaceae bacterium]
MAHPARVAVAQPAASPPRRYGRLSAAALGIGLVVAVCVAWGSGLVFLAARLGLGAPVRLALADGVHVYSGIAGALLLAAKVARFRLRRPPGDVIPWQRWISWSLAVLYGVVLATGVAALLPVHGRLASGLVQVHLLSSVWAIPPTTWHLWHHRRRALARLAPPRRALRLWAGIAVALAPVLLVAGAPAAVSQLSEIRAGSSWSHAAGPLPERLATTPDGHLLAAGADALYLTADGSSWRRMAIPPAPNDAAPGFAPATGHDHGGGGPRRVQALATTPHGVFAGTSDGLYYGRTAGTALARLPFPGHALDGLPLGFGYPGTDVRGLAVRAAKELWAASSAGPVHSADGGTTWTRLADGMTHPSSAAAITYLGSQVVASDDSAVYQWDPQNRRWRTLTAQPGVVDLTVAGGVLFASSSGGELRSFSGGHWDTLTAPGPAHHTGAALAAHTEHGSGGIAAVGGRLYAPAAGGGVSASADGGRTWTQLGSGSRHSAQVVALGGRLWSATPDGVYSFALAPDIPRPSARWWLTVAALALLAGSLGAALSALDRPRRPQQTAAGPHHQAAPAHAGSGSTPRSRTARNPRHSPRHAWPPSTSA